jgi:hypothetical protein
MLGPNGENWIKGLYGSNPGPYCASGACLVIETTAATHAYLGDFCYRTRGQVVSAFNDAEETRFSDIKTLFEEAMAATD